MTNKIRAVKIKETHTSYYALEEGESLSDAINVLERTDHTRVPINSVRDDSDVVELVSIPFDSPLLRQDYSDMANFNFNFN
jgi:hypothetical protein